MDTNRQTGKQTNMCTGLIPGRYNLPDSMNVLYGITDLLPQLFLIKLHLRHNTKIVYGLCKYNMQIRI